MRLVLSDSPIIYSELIHVSHSIVFFLLTVEPQRPISTIKTPPNLQGVEESQISKCDSDGFSGAHAQPHIHRYLLSPIHPSLSEIFVPTE